ncbi:MAG: helix-turn-helix domain-containing protein [Sandaracinaceae bacterium]|nr:helix-turn-helix domain-containing protein [Sandaracinaceae bacterium]
MGGEALPTFTTAQPAALRAEVCERLARALHTDTAFWYDVSTDGCFGAAVTVGSRTVREVVGAQVGSPGPEGSACTDTSPVLRARRGAWQIDRAPARLRTRFRALLEDFTSREAFEALPVHAAFYARCGISDQLRLLPFLDGRFLGWIGALRLDGREFTEAERRLANACVPEVTAGLASARALESIGEGVAFLVAGPGGRVEQACERTRAWLTRERADCVRRVIRGADRGSAHAFRVDGVILRLTRLDGEDGVRYLACLTDAPAPVLGEASALTAAERAVAEAAAAGLTVAEIAELQGASPNTIKAHLKSVYRKLEVATRVELARALAAA